MLRSLATRPFRLAAALALVGAAACNEVTAAEEHGHAEEIAAMRLTVTGAAGTASYQLTDGGVLTPSPLRLPLGVSAVAVSFLDDAGAELDDIPASEYEIRFENLPAGLAFARTGAFSGAFTTTATGTGTMEIELFHLEEQHEDLGPFFLPVALGN